MPGLSLLDTQGRKEGRRDKSHHPLALLRIDLVPEHHKREILRVSRARLDEEFVAPRIERLERLCRVDVVDEYAAVGSSVERDTQRLESFLACSVPELQPLSVSADSVGAVRMP
jgi:hypothetical protein